MREAFLKLARENPKSPIAGIVRGVELTQSEELQAERRTRDLERWGRKFEYIGNSWFHRHGPDSVEKIREEWPRLQQLLAGMQESERRQMISRLADGLNVSEKKLPSEYRVMAALEMLNNPLVKVEEMFSGRGFSPASNVFIEVIGDLSGYSKEQRASFGNFMNRREDLRGSVTLPQTFPAVAEWLVQQSRNNPQSSRLS